MNRCRSVGMWILVLGLVGWGIGCSDDSGAGDDGGVGSDSGCPADTFAQPISFTRYDALLVTSQGLRGALQPLASFHTCARADLNSLGMLERSMKITFCATSQQGVWQWQDTYD